MKLREAARRSLAGAVSAAGASWLVAWWLAYGVLGTLLTAGAVALTTAFAAVCVLASGE